MPHVLILLSPLARRGGNYLTIDRICEHLKSFDLECHLHDPQEFASSHEFDALVNKEKIGLLIGIHALRTGPFMNESGLPYILILGGTDLNVFCNDPKSMDLMTQAVYNARFVVCFSPTNQTKALSLWPDIRSGRLKVIAQAVETSPSKFDLQSYLSDYLPLQDLDLANQSPQDVTLPSDDVKRPIIFAFVGGIRPVKNPLYLVSTFQEWHARDRRIIFLIVGPQLDEKYSRNVFEPAIKSQPGIVYIPGLPLEDTHALMQQSFALVNSSDSEGMSLAILEAMQLGVPVLARDIPGNRSIVNDGITGFLFDSPQTFCLKAQQLLNDKDIGERLTYNAKEYVDIHHSLAQERLAYRELAKECLQNVNGGLQT